MFGRSKAAPAAPEEPVVGKGRPTPTRKAAEAARKQSLSVPKDPKAARVAARERDRSARAEARAGLLSGDPSRLPARDAGPVRSFVRDFVDSRFSAGELFVPAAVLVIIGTFALPVRLKGVTTLIWLMSLVLLVVDGFWIAFRLRRAVAKAFPDEPTRGLAGYAVLRSMQLRRLRLPRARVRVGGRPVAPKRK